MAHVTIPLPTLYKSVTHTRFRNVGVTGRVPRADPGRLARARRVNECYASDDSSTSPPTARCSTF